MVLETGFPPDARVEREALALKDNGYEVFLLCRRSHTGQPRAETYKGIRVFRVEPNRVRLCFTVPVIRARVKTRFPYTGLSHSLWKRLTGLESNWYRLVGDFVRQNRIDILHVHDLKLLNTSLAVARAQQQSVRVVADLHENYPALVGNITRLRKGQSKGLKKQRWWEKIERRTLTRANRVLVVVEEARDRILRYPGITAERISIVRNVVDTAKFLEVADNPLPSGDEALFAGRYVLCYVGYINGPHRGMHTVLEALPRLIRDIPHLLLFGVGSLQSGYYGDTLMPIIQKHGLEPYVHFTGYRNELEFVPYIRRSDLCLCPHQKTNITDTTFPNKVFLYGLFGKPVLASDCLPLKRYVTETGSGLVFESGNPDSFADSVLQLYHNRTEAARLGENGRRWVMDRYSWDHEKQHLISAYQFL